MPDFGKLRDVPLREMWPNEAHDFTPWLASNLSELGRAVGMDLELQKREAEVGEFSLDILARDVGSGHNVVIENQVEQSDHEHLGKLMTYAAAYDAKVIVWVCQSIRGEHQQAVEWLNRSTGDDIQLFVVTVDILRIDDSKPAFRLTPVVYPSEWTRDRRRETLRPSPRSEAYREFFQGLLDELREEHHFTNARAGQPQGWYSFSAGIPSVSYSSSFALNNRVRAEVYLDTGDAEETKKLFDKLHADREGLEKQFGEPLSWERLDEKMASRVAVYRSGSIDDGSEELHTIRSWMIAHLLKFKAVFGPRLTQLVRDLD